uniref:Large surface protein PCAN_A1.28.2 n=1 Tax=Pneumocystis canis TaxID=2698477 RepID=A0A7S5W3H7_9ASCO|nr:large surface protein PCAN_A1.28.2 [Pneumocystis canis]
MLKKRDQGEKGEVIGEEHFLALILKGNTEKNNCKTELRKYCESLNKAGLKSQDVHENLKNVCENGNAKDEKCTDLERKIKEKCKEFKKKLETALNKKPIKNEKCEEYEPECHFLEGACINELIGKCSELRNECYEIKRDKVADEILVRALKGGLKEKNDQCEEKLKKHCQILSRMSKELMRLCLNPKGTCQSLITEAGKKCTSLKKKVEEAVEKVENDSCLPLLEECHFYGPNCEETKCEELRTQCEEKQDILYTPPEEPWFPIQPRVSIIEKVGLDELYKAIAQEGILINKLLHPSMEDLIFFLSQKSDSRDFDKSECENAHKAEQCNYLKTLSGNSDYKCSKMKDKCTELEKKFKKERDSLKGRIQEINLFGENKSPGNPKTIPWHKLESDLNGRKCAQLQSRCFFLDRYYTNLTIACENVKSMCYKRGLHLAAYEVLEDQMRREPQDSRLQSYQCEKKLIKVCDQVKNQSYHLLALCAHPEETCEILFDDIRDKTGQLKNILDSSRDFPEEHDCSELEPECNKLKEEDTFLLGPCHTLKKNCHHLRESQQLRDLLLGEKKNLSDITHCGDKINDKCHYYSRKLYKQFELSCALKNDTCEIIDFYVNKYCYNLRENINELKIVNTLNETNGNMDQLRQLCPTWVPYCDVLLPSCQNELTKNRENQTLCPEIQKLCKPYQTRQTLEDAVFYEFRGNLNGTNTCNTTLEKHCVTWNQTKNDTFTSLCKSNSTYDPNKNNDTVRKELCERLVYRVKKLCKKLPDKLKEEQKELAKRIGVYNELKKEAEEKANKTKVILTFSIKKNTTNETNSTPSHALVKRSEHHPTITEKEAQTFDLVAMVITEYVELKEKCEKLLLDCGFKECQGSQDPCKGIKESCDNLKPLEMRPPEVTTSTTTITQNVTLDSQGKPICTAGAPSISMNCTSIHTTETWVTHTSTHTSTMTKTSTVTSKVTIVSTKKCQPTQCTTDRTHPTHSSGEEAGEVKPSGGIRVNGWGTSGIILMIVLSMIYF